MDQLSVNNNGILVNHLGNEVLGIQSDKSTSFLLFYTKLNYWHFVTYVTSYN